MLTTIAHAGHVGHLHGSDYLYLAALVAVMALLLYAQARPARRWHS
jgi:4-amino-4-deoxy-L-arabinose transferase-like glycosyltransferase